MYETLVSPAALWELGQTFRQYAKNIIKTAIFYYGLAAFWLILWGNAFLALALEPSTLNPQPSSLNPQHSTLKPQVVASSAHERRQH